MKTKKKKFSYVVASQFYGDVFTTGFPICAVQGQSDGFETIGEAIQSFVQGNVTLGQVMCQQPVYYQDESGQLCVAIQFWLMRNPGVELDGQKTSCLKYRELGLMMCKLTASFFKQGKPVRSRGLKTLMNVLGIRQSMPSFVYIGKQYPEMDDVH